ncbi:hypothetical protein HYZ80_04115 [Candidatus Parcubacteria bacterium]|nr:hypothetical protein [Candidatus Parcubacteria bacterium]
MDPNLQSQFTELIARSQRILIFPKPSSRGEEIAAGLALGLYLDRQGKEAAVIVTVPAKLSFLPQPKQVMTEVEAGMDDEFIIRLNTSTKDVAELHYEKTDHSLDIYLRAKDGRFEPTDISFPETNPAADLVITVGVPDLDSLGETFKRDPDLFFSHPIINIDQRSENEQFGELNVIEPGVASVAEIVMQLITASAITPEIATCLLASLMLATRNFQLAAATPATLNRAARLVDHGAERAKIAAELYGPKPIPQLQLAGRILARTAVSASNSLYVSTLQPYDFSKTGTTEADLPQAVEELREHFGQLQKLLVLWSDGNLVHALYGSPDRREHETLAAEEGALRLEDALSRVSFEGIGPEEAQERISGKVGRGE